MTRGYVHSAIISSVRDQQQQQHRAQERHTGNRGRGRAPPIHTRGVHTKLSHGWCSPRRSCSPLLFLKLAQRQVRPRYDFCSATSEQDCNCGHIYGSQNNGRAVDRSDVYCLCTHWRQLLFAPTGDHMSREKIDIIIPDGL